MNRRTNFARMSLAAAALFAAGALVAGPLNPPPGPVAPTHKTLSEIEPRIPINAANTPGTATALFRITQPGSYYLTGNITGVSGKHGIEIAGPVGGPAVSIDLMGHELVGISGSLSGITIAAIGTRNVTVRNGTVRGWGQQGVDAIFSAGNRLQDLLAQSNALGGLRSGTASVISNCSAFANGGAGISSDNSSTIIGCSSSQNAGGGITASTGCVIASCSSCVNQQFGFFVGNCVTIADCTAQDNSTGDGIRTGASCTISRCSAQFNAGDGIDVAAGNSIVTGCTSDSNTGDGIRVGDLCRIEANKCDNNGSAGSGSGLFVGGNRNRIENNSVTNTFFGILVGPTTVGNTVIGNYASANTTNYQVPANNFLGTVTGTSAAMNAAANSMINLSFP